ncbi:hypothetical protein R2G56_00570 [Nitratireductor aquimarinus]|uniref:Uncharacterized protein n=1 Tax=Nitratireductor aquimarinus TaxID=889300 RepID=A0ABU4AEV3_9HYPH|nr:hypothetical protein [Nitratireductor aquimarinus]MDV6224767.1 hypothetical protein [Nitratireductor aquimarinus]
MEFGASRAGLLAAALCLACVTGPAAAKAERIYLCSGYGCVYKKSMNLGAAAKQRLAAIMAGGRSSASAERSAISKAVRYFETLATQTMGVRDDAKSGPGGARVYGQMDCIDESRNTRTLLTYLQRHGLLHHHTVRRNAARGFFIDIRYPHATAVVRAKDGRDWAIDSWYEPAGGAPDIMQLSEWKKRGVRGER